MPKQGTSPLSGLFAQYFVALQQICYNDPHLFLEMAKVQHMLQPPTALFAPDIVGKVLLSVMRNKFKFESKQGNAHGSTAGQGSAAAAAASYGSQSE